MRWLCHRIAQAFEIVEEVPSLPEQDGAEHEPLGIPVVDMADATSHPHPRKESSARNGPNLVSRENEIAKHTPEFDAVRAGN